MIEGEIRCHYFENKNNEAIKLVNKSFFFVSILFIILYLGTRTEH